ncbi:hypothetical protein F2P44_00610 [Massilia sp. CCM 8695]|uniref:Uncharacterized protein n=1 Tax=Massilia frigida TaxID=2609281 RepID=A0ABX0MXN1_9BURK|nr:MULTISPECIES: hypothetical protein [Massilia]MDM5175852.1 hypothetical protein [Massilia sp. DJPM01]NHZ77808.1 hypothetical protein [Massilia frigida]
MPRYARFAHYLLIAVFAYAAVRSVQRYLGDPSSFYVELMLLLWLCAGMVGMYRRVAWGRFFASCFSVAIAFVSPLTLIAFDGPLPQGSVLSAMLNVSTVLTWFYIVITATLVLMPAVLIGIRRDWFRYAWW